MTNPVLPPEFKPVVSGYSISDPGGVLRTDVAGGAARYGLDWDRGMQQFSVTLILDQMQFSVWSAFYHHIIKKGALSFDMRIDSGFGVSPHSVNIVPGSYSAARTSGIMMVVSFMAEAENQVYDMTATDAAKMVAVYGQYGRETQATLDRIARFANVETNVLDF